MFALIRKEINGFLNSLIGYVVILVFLITISLFLWVFPDSEFNILSNGYASLEPLFTITPWVYMFLIPAITMRLFAEEKKTGTLELLITRPLTELQIVFAKYIAGVILVFISLLPTLVYYVTVYQLGLTIGNMDSAATWGSYLGLLLLGACFVAMGVFASALTDNQVIAFIISLFLCLFFYIGFDRISAMAFTGALSQLIYQTGIYAHYVSMSRGVIDTRDLVYFLSLIALFIVLTRTIIESRKW
ncbi:MAG: gliding motility-associated ABC transporter permease subunit GldF [Bacteroidia bacterium]|nr:gliding motility-associated ABC transporter permease subunit GldF [Bacteroidia bacterium]HQV01799.1 gliding motility-associated ABC transporter permease subunit GldF [Bacteroidia bacterium]